MLEAYSRAWIEIDYKAIGHNLDEVKKLVGDTKILGIVKADAYGHGAVACAKEMVAWGVDFFGVSSVDEAIVLRDGGIQENILILGYTPPEHFHYLHEYDLIQTLVSYEYAEKLNQYAKSNGYTIRAHCKVDTGMGRIGIIYKDEHKDIDKIIGVYQLSNIHTEGIFSHFPVSDDLGKDPKAFTMHQIELFKEVLNSLEKNGIDCGVRHIQNSYGILNYGDLGMDYCRPGLLYMGVTSDDEIEIASDPDFIAIMSLYANVSVVKWIYPGQSVSYGRHFIAQKETKVATLSIGYADGLPRIASNQGLCVEIHGQKCPIIGNICMDQCMVDVTNVKDVKEGDVACIVGPGLSIDRISRLAHTINNETLCALSSRVPRLEKKKG